MRRAFLLSLDAMIAVSLLLLLTAFMASISVSYLSPELEYQRFYYAGKDVMNVLQTARLGAVIEFMPVNYSQDCNVTDADMGKTILDVIGYMWAQDSTQTSECAANLTRELLNRTLPTSFGYEVLIDDISIYKEGEPQNYLSRLNTIVSGYELGKPVSGYFASAFIARMAKSTSAYIYFGGYEGDGNITKRATLPDDANVTEAYLEANIGSNFTVYVNGIKVGDYDSTPANFTARNWTLCASYPACQAYFQGGENQVSINFSEFANSYVGGGFLRVRYNSSKPDTMGVFSASNDTRVDNYWFPGIKGLINLYSGFYVPGTLNNLSLSVRYYNNITINDSGLPVFMIIGDREIFRSNASGVVNISMNDSEMRSLLDYVAISNSTVPLRLGMESFFVLGGVGSSDVVLITDRSGSMDECDVWSNQSWDCLPAACDERCSASCDDDDYTCENICGGIWTEVTPAVYVCSGESSQCCDSAVLCQQCNGTYGRRERINVAKDSDDEFIDTVLGFEGNNVGLTGYGTNVCSYLDITGNSTSLHDRVALYDHDCSATCMCCGINKALDLILGGRHLNTLVNSKFTGPSIAGWNESGVVNLSEDIGNIDSLEYEGPDDIFDPDIIHVSGDVFAIAYEHSSDSDGWVKTVQIDTSGGISGPIDSFEFDGSMGENPEIIHVSGDVFAIAYRGPDNDGFVATLTIDSSGVIGPQIDSLEFHDSNIYDPDIIHVSGDVYAVAYRRDSDDDGYLRTFDIDSSGNIGSVIDWLEFDTSRCFRPDITHVSGDIFAIAYRGPDSDGWFGSDGWVRTVDIAADGNIGSVQDSYVFETGDTVEPVITHVSGDVFAIAYRRDSDDDGWIKTIEIQSDGSIAQSFIDWFEFDTSNTYRPDMTKMYGDYYAIAYRGPGNDGWVKVLEISSDGNINKEIVDELEFQTDDTASPKIINASDRVHAIAYRRDSDDNGFVSTIRLGDNEFGLHDFWYVSSNHTTYGALEQNFTLPTGGLVNAYLTFFHSTSDARFDGTAYVYCNLTYPLGDGNGTTGTVWSASWNPGSNPAGPVQEAINITDYFNETLFNYTLKCGADVTAGGGETTVAFDNIILNFTMDRYNAMLVMSDGAATVYCDSFTDFVGSGDGGDSDPEDRDWAINASCNARDNGVEVFSVAFGTGADSLTMQKVACWNCSSNDWFPGEEEDNCTRYYESNNAEEMMDVYREIAQNMGQARYEAQTVNITGDVSVENALYPDSYIRYNYTPQNVLDYGEVSIALESGRFGGIVTSPKSGTFYIPYSRILDARVTSYSSEYWTSYLQVNSTKTGGWSTAYNISDYGQDFVNIGDPFIVNIPVDMLQEGGNNSVLIDTGLSADLMAGGSPDDRVIYYVGVSGIVGYGGVYGTLVNATSDAVQRLQNQLSEFNITLLEVETPSQYISELPSLWGPSVMEIRIWT